MVSQSAPPISILRTASSPAFLVGDQRFFQDGTQVFEVTASGLRQTSPVERASALAARQNQGTVDDDVARQREIIAIQFQQRVGEQNVGGETDSAGGGLPPASAQTSTSTSGSSSPVSSPVRPPLPGAGDESDLPTADRNIAPPVRPPLPGAGDEADLPTADRATVRTANVPEPTTPVLQKFIPADFTGPIQPGQVRLNVGEVGIPKTAIATIFGIGGDNIREVFTRGNRRFLRLNDNRVVEDVGSGDFIFISADERSRFERADQLQREINVYGSLEEAIEARQPDQPTFGDVFRDNLIEGLSFGQAETETFNTENIGQRYDDIRNSFGQEYDNQVAEMRAQGQEPTETREEFLNRALPDKEDFVQDVLDAQPELRQLATQFGEAMIPIYGTAKTWEENPGWANAISVASDLAFFIPIIGQVAAASRAGQSLTRTAIKVTAAEFTAPARAIANPFATVRGTAASAREIAEIADVRRVPLSAIEARDGTIRIPTNRGAAPNPGNISVDDQVLRGINPTDAMRARDELTANAIRGDSDFVRINEQAQAGITTAGFTKVRPAAFHASPDIRNFLAGVTIQSSRSDPGQGLFVAPGFSQRFARSSATGNTAELTEQAERLVGLRQLSQEAVPGGVIITDPKLLAQLQSSNKLWRGAAEVEATLPPGVNLPPPSQILFTRGPDGRRLTLAIIGDPLSLAERAKLKIIGGERVFSDIFSRPGRVTADSSVNTSTDYARAADEAEEALGLLKQADNSDDPFRAVEFQERAEDLLDAAAARASRRSQLNDLPVRETALYTGDQDIRAGLERITEEPELQRVDLDGSRVDETLAPTRTRVQPDTLPSGSRRRVDGGGEATERIRSTRGNGTQRTNTDGPRTPDDTSRTPPPSPPRRVNVRTVPTNDGRVRVPSPDDSDVEGRVRVQSDEPSRIRLQARPGLRRPRINKQGDVERNGQLVDTSGVVAWRQGFGYWVVLPPYRGRQDAAFSRRRPNGVPVEKGPDSAFKTISRLGGQPISKSFMLDLGIVDASVAPGKRRPRLRFAGSK